MHERTYEQLNNLVEFMEASKWNKEKVYTIPQVYEGAEIKVQTDREGFLEYVIDSVQNTLMNEMSAHEIERGD